MIRKILTAIIVLLPVSLFADEVWDTEEGRVTYLAEVGSTAVWETQNLDGTMRMYFPGLAGNFNNRSVHEGYWIQHAGQGCGGSVMTGPDGFEGANWGELKLIFHASGFPTDWTMLIGTCFDDPVLVMRGTSPLSSP